MDFFTRLFDPTDFPPRRQCGTWTEELIALHTTSDTLIWLAYMAIPAVLIYFARRRKDLPFPWMFWLFGLFIVSCGFTHLIEVIIFYSPIYRFAGLVKAVTAVASWVTVLSLVPLVPRALALRSPHALQHEVAERRRVEDALRASEERYRALVESARDYALFLLDADGRVFTWNAGAEQLTGYTAAESRGRPLADYFPAEDVARGLPAAHLNLAAAQGRVEQDGYRRRKDGTAFWANVILTAQRDRDGRLSGFALLMRDVGAARRAAQRQSLQFAVTRVLAASANFPDALTPLLRVMCQNTGWDVGEWWVKKGEPPALHLEAIWHDPVLPLDEFVTASWLQTFAPGDGLPGHIWANGQAAWGSPLTAAAVASPRAGLSRAHHLNASFGVPILAGNDLLGILLFFSRAALPPDPELLTILEDLARQIGQFARRKQAEAEVRRLNEELEARVVARTAQLQDANKELEAFSYSVSHDLRAPLRAVDGFSRILLKDHGAELTGDAREFLQLVRDNTLRMGQLIDDLLAFSRLGRQSLCKQAVNPAGLVRQALEDLGTERAGRNVVLVVGDLPECQADPALLRQVFVNLLANSLKFTRGRDPSRVEVGHRQQEGEAATVYFVRDNGVGFDMRYAEKLFGVFQRLHRQEDYEGTGVGLATVQRIVHRHGGRIWAEAVEGEGATFFFTLGEGAGHDDERRD